MDYLNPNFTHQKMLDIIQAETKRITEELDDLAIYADDHLCSNNISTKLFGLASVVETFSENVHNWEN